MRSIKKWQANAVLSEFADDAGWLVVLDLTAFWDSISVYIGPSPKEREKQRGNDRREKIIPNTPTRTNSKRSRPLPYSNPI